VDTNAAKRTKPAVQEAFMSLVDALLIEQAAPLNQNEVWLAIRTDGEPGDGSRKNPFDASTAVKFDDLMRLRILANTKINLGPGRASVMAESQSI